MQRPLFLIVSAWMGAYPASASVTVSVAIVDPNDVGPNPPANVVLVDVFVDVTGDDYWTASGFRGTTVGPARIVYARHPQDGRPLLVNPGSENPFVTCVSRPYPLDADERFDDCGAAIVGGYFPNGPTTIATSTELNVNWFGSPPVGTDGSDGAILRLALWRPGSCTGGSVPHFRVAPLTQSPGLAPVLICECPNSSQPGIAAGTFDQPNLVGIRFGVYEETFGPPCPYDFNCNWSIDLGDLTQVLSAFGICAGEPGFDPRTDFDGDDCTGLADLSQLLARFGRGYSPYLGCP